MYGSDLIGSTLGDFIYAVLHPSVANLPAGSSSSCSRFL